MKIKRQVAVLLNTCNGTGLSSGTDHPPGSVTSPVKLIDPASPAHPFFYVLKYSVDQTRLPATGPNTEFSFLLVQTKSDDIFKAGTEGQIIRRNAGDLEGASISAIMIQAGDETERIYDAAGPKVGAMVNQYEAFEFPKFSNRPAKDTYLTNNFKYSRSLRLLRPNTNYHLYVRVNDEAPILLRSIKTAELPTNPGTVYNLTYDFTTATAGSTLTQSTRYEEPFYPMASGLFWGNVEPRKTYNSFRWSNIYLGQILITSPTALATMDRAVEKTDDDFINMRYVDAALDLGMATRADNSYVYWFDKDVTHKDSHTVRLKKEFLDTSDLQKFATVISNSSYNTYLKILH